MRGECIVWIDGGTRMFSGELWNGSWCTHKFRKLCSQHQNKLVLHIMVKVDSSPDQTFLCEIILNPFLAWLTESHSVLLHYICISRKPQSTEYTQAWLGLPDSLGTYGHVYCTCMATGGVFWLGSEPVELQMSWRFPNLSRIGPHTPTCSLANNT